MGEWSEYFEDFPEENPSNWINGRFDPELRSRLNQMESKNADAQTKANAELHALITKAKKETKARSLMVTEDCPQCGLNQLNTYKISDNFYLCECQDCGIYGNGTTHEKALEKTRDALGYGLDWRDGSLY
ncbi:MAG: hypothetical protein QX197_00595 [Methylococcaceae bacterium]